MAVSWRKYHRPSLETQLWRVLRADGRDWLVKSLFKEDSYEILLSDLSTIWEEGMEARAIARRAKVIVGLKVQHSVSLLFTSFILYKIVNSRHTVVGGCVF